MTDFWKYSVRRNNEEYELAVSWEVEEFEEGAPTIGVRAVQRFEGGEEKAIDASVSIESNSEDQPDVVIRVGKNFEYRTALGDVIDADRLLEMIPAWAYGGGNPILGCLLRAGISATVGQLLACRRRTLEYSWFVPRVRAIGVCFRSDIGGIGRKAARRAARCLMRVGF